MSRKTRMKGILLAGGSGSRLWPATRAMSKQLLPIYDKPTIYYPLSTLMLAGIRDILIISTSRDLPTIQSLLGDGSSLGIDLSYEIQPEPKGIAHAFLVGAEFVAQSPICLILGDNLFFGRELPPLLSRLAHRDKGATILASHVDEPERFGVVEIGDEGQALSLEEKPEKPKSSWAVTGLYFYGPEVVDIARSLTPSARSELEITDVNKAYLDRGELRVEVLGKGIDWLDTGTPESWLEASNLIAAHEARESVKIACLEEVAFLRGLIGPERFAELSGHAPNSEYGQYLRRIAKGLT